MQAGEPDLLALAVGLHPTGDLVLIAQHLAAGRHLMDEDVPLGVDVLLHILVVVQMVGGNVGDHRDLRALVHTDQLEAGQLHNRHILRSHLGQHGQQSGADVATQVHLAASGLIELGDEGGGGGLAVGAGHAHDLTGAEIKEKLHLAGDHGTRRHSVLQGLFKIAHKAGGTHDDVPAFEAFEVVFAQAQVNAQLPDGGSVIAKIVHGLLLVAEGHMSAQLHKLLDERLMADAGTNECNLFALDQCGKLLLFFLHKSGSSQII